MAGRLIEKGSASSRTVASPSASRRTIERRVGSDNAAKTTSNRSEAVTVAVIVAVPPADISRESYLTNQLTLVNAGGTMCERVLGWLQSSWVRVPFGAVAPVTVPMASGRTWAPFPSEREAATLFLPGQGAA